MVGELISNCTHTSYTTIIVGELIVQSFPLPWYCWSHNYHPRQKRCIHVGSSSELMNLEVRHCQGPPNGGVSNGGVSRSGLVLPFLSFLSFLGLSRFIRDFPDLLGDGPGIFPIRPVSLSRPIKSTYEEQSRKGPRHNLDLSRKKWETPGFGNPPV